MRTLIVGAGALGGLVAARLRASGVPVALATRDEGTAAQLRRAGLSVSGVGGAASAGIDEVAPLSAFTGPFELVLLATKAQDAVDVGPRAAALLAPGGTLLPIQNGGVAHLLAERLGDDVVLGGLSNLGATMTAPGHYEQRNQGHLLIGELAGGTSARVERVARWLERGVETRTTENVRGAVWSKLLINCSVTTIGAIAGTTMRGYIATREGRALFDRTYDEALAVAGASGARPERMLVDPVPPGWAGRSTPGPAHEAWIGEVARFYGDAKPSMLQDFERGRATEIDFINGFVADLGARLGVATPANAAIVDVVLAITRGELAPSFAALERAAHTAA